MTLVESKIRFFFKYQQRSKRISSRDQVVRRYDYQASLVVLSYDYKDEVLCRAHRYLHEKYVTSVVLGFDLKHPLCFERTVRKRLDMLAALFQTPTLVPVYAATTLFQWSDGLAYTGPRSFRLPYTDLNFD